MIEHLSYENCDLFLIKFFNGNNQLHEHVDAVVKKISMLPDNEVIIDFDKRIIEIPILGMPSNNVIYHEFFSTGMHDINSIEVHYLNRQGESESYKRYDNILVNKVIINDKKSLKLFLKFEFLF